MEKKFLNIVREIIAEVAECNIEDVQEETNLLDEIGIDSLKALEISVRLQKKTKIKIRSEEVVSFITPNAIVDLLLKE